MGVIGLEPVISSTRLTKGGLGNRGQTFSPQNQYIINKGLRSVVAERRVKASSNQLGKNHEDAAVRLHWYINSHIPNVPLRIRSVLP
jgi:hypothetical protein